MSLDQHIEAILFWRAEPVALADLVKWLEKSEGEIKEALKSLEAKLIDRGIKLVFKDDAVMLGTAPETSELIARLAKEEFSRDLGRASLEALTVVLYRGPVSRADIDYIRGVNSSFILRHLLVRGLVERESNPADGRSFLYRPSFALLNHLGISRLEDLPEYGTLTARLDDFVNSQQPTVES